MADSKKSPTVRPTEWTHPGKNLSIDHSSIATYWTGLVGKVVDGLMSNWQKSSDPKYLDRYKNEAKKKKAKKITSFEEMFVQI